MFWLALLLTLAFALTYSVNYIFELDRAALLARFARASIEVLAGMLPALAIVGAVDRRLQGAPGTRWWLLVAAILGATLVGTVASTAVVAWQLDGKVARFRWWGPHLGYALARHFAVTTLVAALGEFERRSLRSSAALHEAQLSNTTLQGQLAEARLQMLQAQIEPHFLFNSLANVRRLSRIDSAAGAALLADLLHYLEATLPHLREAESTLAREMALARAFLAVHKVRMGERLTIELELPTALNDVPVPPMMLITLIENALKHGLAPLPEGGHIRIDATRDAGGSIRLRVADDGRGMVAGLGRGTGLANIRARLQAAYGSAAQLTLQVNAPRGVVASIVLPVRAP